MVRVYSLHCYIHYPVHPPPITHTHTHTHTHSLLLFVVKVLSNVQGLCAGIKEVWPLEGAWGSCHSPKEVLLRSVSGSTIKLATLWSTILPFVTGIGETSWTYWLISLSSKWFFQLRIAPYLCHLPPTVVWIWLSMSFVQMSLSLSMTCMPFLITLVEWEVATVSSLPLSLSQDGG